MRRQFSSLCAALVAMLALGAPAANAQDPFSEFFGGLFGGGRRHATPSTPSQPSEPRVRRIMPHRENRAPAYWHGQSEKPRRAARRPDDTAAPSSPAPSSLDVPATPAVEPTFFVATLGDTLGFLLANGMREGFADRPEISVQQKSKENSGLVRDDYFDWVKASREIAGQKLNVAVMMVGSNDRQAIHRGAETLEPLSPQWREIYTQRVDAVIAAFKEKNVALIWVGLPVMKNERFSADMQQLNEIYRERVDRAGQTFVDLSETLADEKGQFSAFGPDINGQIVKLRTADGVHFTAAGARNIAHFVRSEARKLFEPTKSPAQPAAPTAKPDARIGPAAPAVAPVQPLVFRSPVNSPAAAPALPERPAVGVAQSLDAVTESLDTELARRAGAPAASQALVRHVIIDGRDQPARPNRADDSSWPTPP